MDAGTKKAKQLKTPFYHLVMTSLFYPAVLGVIFYEIFESFSQVTVSDSAFPLLLASAGIVLAFTFDYVYTFSHGENYSLTLFGSDVFILLLLYVAYQSLTKSIETGASPSWFFISFTIIHLIFCIWDLALIPEMIHNKFIVTYDAIGLIVSVVGWIFFQHSLIMALVTLWVIAVFYAYIGYTQILPRLSASAN